MAPDCGEYGSKVASSCTIVTTTEYLLPLFLMNKYDNNSIKSIK